MKRYVVLWWVLLAAGATGLAVLQESPDPLDAAASEELNAETLSEPPYSVNVSRMGKTLRVSLVTASREQAQTLFGDHYEHRPTIDIYKGDQLLASGQFAFG